MEGAELFKFVGVLVKVFQVHLLGGWEKVLAVCVVLEVQGAIALGSRQ